LGGWCAGGERLSKTSAVMRSESTALESALVRKFSKISCDTA